MDAVTLTTYRSELKLCKDNIKAWGDVGTTFTTSGPTGIKVRKENEAGRSRSVEVWVVGYQPLFRTVVVVYKREKLTWRLLPFSVPPTEPQDRMFACRLLLV